MEVLVPFAVREPKTRLGDIFTAAERREFAKLMLEDVCAAIDRAGSSPTVLSTKPMDSSWPVLVDNRPLTEAVNARLEPPIAVVMSDLALLTPAVLSRLVATDGEIVIAPGLRGGTNAIVVRHPDFYTDYHGASVADHRQIAEEVGSAATTVDSFRLAVDIDEPDDLAEVLLHGTGQAAEWLESAGFGIEVADGRVTTRRSSQ